MKLVCLVGALAALSLNASATEADYFTRRVGYSNASATLDKKMTEVLRSIGKESSTCSDVDLHKAILNKLAGFVVAPVERWVNEVPDHFAPAFKDSIYAGLDSDARFLSWGCCAPVIKIGATLVSGDKLGHFVQSGFEMYYVVRSISRHPIADSRPDSAKMFDWYESAIASPEIEALKARLNVPPGGFDEDHVKAVADRLVVGVSHIQENGSWGLGFTGVKSYGDMAANFEGYQFWAQLTSGSNPYFRCSNHKWKMRRAFHWTEYVSDSWDEGINCNEYKTKHMQATVDYRVRKLAARHRWPASRCPVTPSSCSALALRYGDISETLLHPDCLKAAHTAFAESIR